MRRILMANHHLWQPGGTETWTRTVSDELLRRGYDVEVLPVIPGRFARTLACPVVSEPTGRYDLALVNQNSSLDRARAAADRVILTCHGIYPDLEQPMPGADAYVSVSEEVRDHLAALGYPSSIIRNPVDCERFRPRRPIGEPLGRVLSLCHGEAANAILSAACARLGLDFLRVQGARVYDVECLMNEADLVAGLGRSALEAMACGRAALVMDTRPYGEPLMDGLVTPETLPEMLTCNLSGRRFRRPVEEDAVAAELQRYSAVLGEFDREFVVRELDVARQVDAYLALAEAI